MSRPKHEFLVGYRNGDKARYGLGQCQDFDSKRYDKHDYAHSMTPLQALRGLKLLPCRGGAIFRLVEVTPEEVAAIHKAELRR